MQNVTHSRQVGWMKKLTQKVRGWNVFRQGKFMRSLIPIIWKGILLWGVFLFSLYYTSSEILAQSNDLEKSASDGAIEKNWALQFQIDRDFTLSAFQGTILSAKYQVSVQNAFRLGVSGDLAKSSEKDNEEGPSYYREGSEEESSMYDIGLTFQYLRYPNPTNRILVFYGIGPFWRYTTDSYSFAYTEEDDESEDKRESTRKTWRLGVAGVMGVEWFVTRDISLLGEYGIQAGYYSRKSSWEEEDYFEGTDEIKRSRVFLEPSSVKFGLSVYF